MLKKRPQHSRDTACLASSSQVAQLTAVLLHCRGIRFPQGPTAMAVCVDLKDNSHVIPLFKLSNSDSLIRYTLFIGFFRFSSLRTTVDQNEKEKCVDQQKKIVPLSWGFFLLVRPSKYNGRTQCSRSGRQSCSSVQQPRTSFSAINMMGKIRFCLFSNRSHGQRQQIIIFLTQKGVVFGASAIRFC